MNKLLLTVLTFFTISLSFAQNTEHETHSPNGCATDVIMQELYKQHPELLEKQKASEQFYQRAFYQQQNQPSWRSAAVVTIPVVVHVMHLPGTPVGVDENVSAATIQAGIQHLTEAYRKQTSSYNGVGHNANISGVDVELEFCLAKQDPNGNPTSGINRVATILSNLDRGSTTSDAALKSLSYWNSTQYLNIWLVKSICTGSGATLSCGIAGYAYYAGAHGRPFDGVVNRASLFGSSRDNSKVHVHEVGHYFDLAHTFGDANTLNCTNGNCLLDGDRVCDTPPDQTDASVACGSAQNSCSSDADDTDPRNPYRLAGLGNQDDNYENYMDYGFQACQNTFTAGQKIKMLAALNGIRSSLLTSLGCTLTSTAALASFADNGGSLNENAATQSIDCRGYVDVNVPLQLLNPSSSSVTVNISVGVGTASNMADFELLTPSVSIAAGATTANATLRIFNDKAIESAETVVLNIATATAGIAPFNNTYTFSIVDNDIAPSGATPVVFSDDFSASSGWISSYFGVSPSNAFANKFTIGANGGVNGSACTNGKSLYISNDNGASNAYSNSNDYPLIYRTINATGYTGLKAEFDYKVGGSTMSAFARVSTRPGTSGAFTNYNIPNNNISCSTGFTFNLSTFNNSTFTFGYAFETNSGTSANNPSFTIDNLKILADATPISSTITSISEYLGPNSIVNFSNATGELLATIENLSNHDYGCTTVEIDRAGATTTSNAGKTFTTKTFKVTPTTNLATGSHRTTLYYTDAEVSAWTTATGAGVTAMGLFKSDGAIATATSVTDGTSKSTASFGTSTAFAATFSTGFSGFGVANSTVLAVDLLTFEGIKGNKNVKLRWKTASEKNNDYFIIEKSRDGQTFEDLAKVTSQGISTDISDYETFDNAPAAGMNYYRLKSVDKGGQVATSKVVSVAFVEKIKLTVYPNPTTVSKINVELTSDRDERIDFEVLDIVGKTVHTMSQNVTNGLNTIAFDNLTVSKGIYFIRAKQNGIVTAVVRFVRL
jgi:hypothetical protein